MTSLSPLTWEYLPDGVLLIEDGQIRDIGPAENMMGRGLDVARLVQRPQHLLVPGLIDAHVHAPQIDVVGAMGVQLLDWLSLYTFPAEARFADAEYAAAAAEVFLDLLLAAGTTTAMVYSTSHLQATDALFSAAWERGMRLIAGKVLMDQHGPEDLLDSPGQGVLDSETLIRKWHGKGRLGYAITPRFAGTSTRESLIQAHELHETYPDTWIQTHLAENMEEVAHVRSIHPYAADYLEIYEQCGLVTRRSAFGHCIHLSDSEVMRMSDAGARAVFCPSSNLFLGSGLFDLERFRKQGVSVALGTDVGAGTSLSLLNTLGDAYKVCQLTGSRFTAMDALGMATLGNAQALHLDSRIGSLLPGREADLVFLDPGSNELLARRVAGAQSIEEELGIYITLGDEQCVAETVVSGKVAYSRDSSSSSG